MAQVAGKVRVETWISPELAAHLRERAQAEDRSVSSLTRLALRSFVAGGDTKARTS